MAEELFGSIADGMKAGMDAQADQAKLAKQSKTDAALNTYRQNMTRLSEKRLELQERSADIAVMGTVRQILSDKDLHPQARSFMLDQLNVQLGGDNKSDMFKELKKVILTMPVDQANGLTEAMVTAMPNMEPGQVRQVITGLLQGKVPPQDIPKMLMELNTKGGRSAAFSPGGGAPPPDPNAPPIPQVGANPPAPAPGAAPTEPAVEGMDAGELRKRALERFQAGDMEGGKAALQMANDISPKEGNSVNINNFAEKEDTKNRSGRDYKRLEVLDKEVESAHKLNESLSAFEIALDSGRFTPGVLGPQRESLSRVADFLGINPEKYKEFGLGDAATAETMVAASNRLGLELADKMSRMTNMSLEFVKDAIPNLSRTTSGNKIIIEMLRKANTRTIEAQALAEEYETMYGDLRPDGKRSYFQALGDLKDKPLFDDAFKEKVQKAVREGDAVVDPSKAAKRVGATSEATGEEVNLNGKTYKSVGTSPQGFKMIEIENPLTTKMESHPVIMSTEDWDMAPPGTYVWGGTGALIVKQGKR